MLQTRCEDLGGNSTSTSRHTSHLLWLLPSGPDQIHKVSLRGTNGVTILRLLKFKKLTLSGAHYHLIPALMQDAFNHFTYKCLKDNQMGSY